MKNNNKRWVKTAHHYGTLENENIDNELHVILFTPPRTGSTLVFNVLTELVRFTTKTHEIMDLVGSEKTVVCVRDPLDWGASFGRVTRDLSRKDIAEGALLDKDAIDNLILPNIKKYNSMLDEVCGASNNILILQYEHIYKSYETMFNAFESFLDIKISEEKRSFISSSIDIKAVEKIMKKYASFSEGDSITGVHGNHIFTGREGSYKDIITPSLLEYYKKRIIETYTDSKILSSFYPKKK